MPSFFLYTFASELRIQKLSRWKQLSAGILEQDSLTLDGTLCSEKMVMWAFFLSFQHHDNVSQSWAPEDVRAPRVCRMREKDPRQVLQKSHFQACGILNGFFRYLLKALDMYWHEDCLKCGCCDCRLGEVGSTLYTKGNLLLCKRDYLR